MFAGVLDDVSLLPLVPAGATLWHQIACHLVVQGMFAAAFGIGRGLHRRYWAVSEQLAVAVERHAAMNGKFLHFLRPPCGRSSAVYRDAHSSGE